ncbi:MAG: PQQ-dependent sugar dehydrogenase [Gammaproteobacteria bacterium]|nr:PQQ-dependent sugar dehydrogenase [Gammaproteobacteria bacterium]
MAGAAAHAADATAGRQYFRQQCLLCHSAEADDGGGAQGPALDGLLGRAAASNPAFSFTPALQQAGLRWDAATLDRFLAAPTLVVPGSTMVNSVPAQSDRDNLIAYFSALQAGTPLGGSQPAVFPPPEWLAQPSTPMRGTPDWQADTPGRVHRISPDMLAAPYATPAARNFPRLVPRPAGALPRVPDGFRVNVFAENLTGPRRMLRAPNGDILLAETQSGRIKVLRPSADGTHAASISVYAQGLMQPFGIAWYPVDGAPEWLYVAEHNRVVRYAYHAGDTLARGVPEVVVAQLVPHTGGHYTRDLAFSSDGRRMFVSVGSESNVAEGMPRKSPAEVQGWEREHGRGAAWGRETGRASVLAFAVGSSEPGRTYATGLRNCVGLTLQPATGELWCTVNERDMLGDDLVPDYSTRVREGGFYGWPWYYLGAHQDPRLEGQRPDLHARVLLPDVLYQAHSAALTLDFYAATSGRAAFPAEYVGDGFAVFHGSWNRGFRTGHKIVRVRMRNGVPTGEYQDFLTGFITDNDHAWARPVATVVAADGALLLSEDGNGVIYRIAWQP